MESFFNVLDAAEIATKRASLDVARPYSARCRPRSGQNTCPRLSFNKRVGTLYNDNGTLNGAVKIQPFNVTNVYLNYTIRGHSYLRGTKIRFGVNNLFDQHNIVGVVPFSTASNKPAPGDILTLLPARSVNITMTFGYAPER